MSFMLSSNHGALLKRTIRSTIDAAQAVGAADTDAIGGGGGGGAAVETANGVVGDSGATATASAGGPEEAEELSLRPSG